MQEYLDNILSASTAKAERIQQMADDVRRKDDQLASMLSRMDAKDKQMTDLIAQVTSMNTQSRRDDSEDDKSNRKQNDKRKAKEGGVGRTDSGDKCEVIPIKGDLGWWTPHARFNFGLAKGVPFSISEIKWDPRWPADKRAF